MTHSTRHLMTRRFVGALGAVNAACVTFIVLPATRSVAVRVVVPVFAAIV